MIQFKYSCRTQFTKLIFNYICNKIYSVEVDTSNEDEMRKIVSSAIGTKFINKWSKLACDMAIKAVSTVCLENKQTGAREIDIKRYAKVEKVSLF